MTAAGSSALRRLMRCGWRRLPTWLVILSPLPRERTRATMIALCARHRDEPAVSPTAAGE